MSEETQKTPNKVNFLLGLFVGMAAISAIGFFSLLAVVFSQGQPVNLSANAADSAQVADADANADEPTDTQQPTAGPVPAITADDHVVGGKDAKVTLIVYTDFECPYCSRHFDTTEEIIKAYGDKIKFVVRHFPLSFHANAQKAAEASECASEQGKFWEMHDAIFAANKAKDMSIDKWKAEAKNLGLNTTQFNSCLDSGKYANKVSQQASGGASAGVDGTPATFINGELVSGALPVDSFKAQIDKLLGQ